MANQFAIHSVGNSLRRYLENAYPEPLRTNTACSFRLLSSGEFMNTGNFGTTLSLYLYRVTMNEYLRNVPRINQTFDDAPPIAVDLHYLLTVWANNALAEHTILAWAMRGALSAAHSGQILAVVRSRLGYGRRYSAHPR